MTGTEDKNVTRELLSGLPFKKASDFKKAQENIQLAIWKRLEEAKVIDTIIKKPEYKFWRDEFTEGFVCGFGEKDGNLVRVYSDGTGIKININAELNTVESSEHLLGVLIKSMSESFAHTYYKAKGILPNETIITPDGQSTETNVNSKERKATEKLKWPLRKQKRG